MIGDVSHRGTRRGVPTIPEWPGSSVAFTRRPIPFLRRAHHALGSDVVRFTALGKTIYSLRGPAAAEAFVTDPRLDARGGFVETVSGLLPRRFGSEGASLLRASFDLGSYLDAARASSREVIAELGSRGELDPFELASQLSFRAASRVVLGETVMSPGFYARWRELFFATSPVEARGRWDLLNPLSWRKQEELFTELERFFARLVDARETLGDDDPRCVLDHMLSALGPAASHQRSAIPVYATFLGAYLGPARALGWVLVDLLRSDPPWRARVAHEIAASWSRLPVIEALGRPAIARLDVLDRCVMETFRMRTPALDVREIVDVPLIVGGHEVPIGALACYAPALTPVTRFERPHEYDPDRWIDAAECEPSAVRSMPFAHIVPGKRVSSAWLQSSIADLLGHFEMELVSEVPGAREDVVPVLADRDGPCAVRYRRRSLA